MISSRSFSLALGLLLVALPNSAFSENHLDTDPDTTGTDIDTDEKAPHHGCLLFLQEKHIPQEPLVGKDFEAFSTRGYRVEDEAGPTAASCKDGFAGGYPCNNIDLMSVTSLASLDETSQANDIWGWTHSESGREFAIVGLESGTAFVEITDPYNPVFVGKLPARNGHFSKWRDMKTYRNYVYIVTEKKFAGMQIFALERLLDATPSTAFTEDATYDEFENAHNIFINEETASAYVVGSNTCSGGLHIVDLNDPLNPSFETCFDNDGYTHDVQCVNYSGPDTNHSGKEICFASNADTVAIIDKSIGKILSNIGYDDEKFTHQGWLTKDHKFFIFGDEQDELALDLPKTRTHVLDVSNLSSPQYVGYYEGRTKAIDHNLYVLNDQVYQANYSAGLNILKIVDPSTLSFEEVGFFDIFPDSDENKFNGAWSTYPYFPSGNIIVSGVEQGLFVLKQTNSHRPPSCYEKSSDRFFKSEKDGVESTMSCRALSNKNKSSIAKICNTTQSGSKSGSAAPAKEICTVTCGTCPCGEIARTKFFFKVKKDGKFRYKRCKELKNKMSENKRKKVCELDAPKESKELAAKFACPLTCPGSACPNE